MSHPAPPTAGSGRRCAPRTREPGDLRPTDVVGAFFVCGLAFMLAGAIAGIVEARDPWPWGRWLALHLVFVGGVSQLVLGASQFFAGAFLATDPPDRQLVRAQLAAWSAGSVLLAVAVPEGPDLLVDAAVGLLLAGIALYAWGMVQMRGRSLSASPWATRWYLAATGFFAVGIVAGAMLAVRAGWPHGDLLAGHMALNLAGWFGAAIVGTLHTFFPSLTQTQLRFPRLQTPTFVAWGLGVAALAVGYGWDEDLLAVGGWLLLGVSAALLLANVAGCVAAARPAPLSLPARVIGVAQLFLPAAIVLAASAAIADGAPNALVGSNREAVGTLLVAGWIGLTVLGSLLHLLAVVLRVRDFSRGMPVPRPARDSAIALVAGIGVAALAVSQGAAVDWLRDPAKVLLIAAYALLGARVAVLGTTVVRRARPRI